MPFKIYAAIEYNVKGVRGSDSCDNISCLCLKRMNKYFSQVISAGYAINYLM